MKRLALLLAAALMACGPSTTSGDDDDTGDGDGGPGSPDAYSGPAGTVSGRVWAPGNAPGMVPAGHEIPVFGALVYLSLSKPPPIPPAVHCEQCVDPPGKAIFTDHAGNFTIPNVAPNDYWLIIQKGQWRIEQQISVTADSNIAVPDTATTLPSKHDPGNGLWVPKIAIATGVYDQIEDILGKMGFGQVDGSGQFVPSTATGNFDVYSNGSYNMDAVAIAPLTELFKITSAPGVEPVEGPMMDYHIIFIPCSTQTFGDFSSLGLAAAPNDTLRAVREYVKAGGKLYVTDWSGEWEDNIFPQQIRFASDHDTPASAWNESTETWNTAQFNDADGSPSYESEHARAIDEDLNTWLGVQQGPIVLGGFGGYGTGVYDSDNFVIEGNWDHIEELIDVQVGVDDEGFPVIDSPHAYIIGDEGGTPSTCTGTGAGCNPLTLTFEPAGCGRVLYSTYHTAENTHVGLVPQERVLLYLIMEIGICKSGPIVN